MSNDFHVPVKVQKRIEQLREILNYHGHLYYVLDKPEITDEAYDSLMRELHGLEEQYPKLRVESSPTVRIGGKPLETFMKVKHEVRQWSLDNVFDATELAQWEEKILRILKKDSQVDASDLSYCCELKIDGLKIVLVYKNGVFVRGATRGDGTVGEDITHNLRTIGSIPLKLEKQIDIVVEGEVWLPGTEFKRINKERKKGNEPLFANPRNAAAGTLRQLDPSVTAKRRLDTFMYDVTILSSGKNSIDVPKTQIEELELLSELGFKVEKHYRLSERLTAVEKFYTSWVSKKKNVDFGVDGIVVKVNSKEFQALLGYTGKAPRFAVAYKFPAEQVTTKVLDIVLQVGRTGVLTPVACLDPVHVAGSVVRRATLHNEDEIKRLDVRIGDTVILQKAGDVIPDIVEVVKKLRTGREKRFIFPKRVSSCGSDGRIERVPGQAAYRCVNRDSFAQQKQKFYYFVSKKALAIDGLGPRIIDTLLENNLIATYADIFTLEKGDFDGLPGFADKLADNLLRAINQARTVSLSRLLIGLSIAQVGEETAHDLALHFGMLRNLEEASRGDLEAIEGVGEVVAGSIYSWFRQSHNKKMLKHLLKQVTVQETHGREFPKKTFAGKVFVLTGTLKTFTREEAKEKIRARGGSVTSSVSKKVDYVIAGDSPGSKFNKAQALRVAIVGEEEFAKMISN